MTALLNMPRAAWKRQPSGRVTASNFWRSRGLVALFRFYPTLIDVIDPASTRATIATFGTPTTGVSRYGVGLKTTTNSGYKAEYPIPLCADAETHIGLVNITARTDYGAVFTRADQTGATNKLAFQYGNYGFPGIYVGNDPYPSSFDPLNAGFFIFGLSGSSSSYVRLYIDGKLNLNPSVYTPALTTARMVFLGEREATSTYATQGDYVVHATFNTILSHADHSEIARNVWQLFAPDPPRFYLIPSSGSSPTSQISIDALIQRAGLTQTTSLDALLQSAFSRSLSIDGLIAATQAGTISLDALLQIVGTRTVSVDALVQAVKSGTVSVDALVQMTLAQSLSLDALIVAASASSSSTDLDALIQALKTAGISLDALLSQSKTATAVIDALIQASKAGTVSLDAIIAGASSTTVFVGLDALIQAIQSKTLSVDALLQKTQTNPLSLDAYVALTQIKTVSLDALLQNTKTGVISMDAILQMTKTAMVSFDALIQAAKTGVISLDAILVFATQASLLLDAYVQKTLSAGVGLDAIIGAIADMILPTGRVITVPASDRFVFVTHSDRVIQIQ